MAIIVTRLRMSLFWTARFPTLLSDAPPPGAPLVALGQLASYEPIFVALLGAPATPIAPVVGAAGLELPWRPEGTQWFWCRYLNANPLRRIKGTFAFVRLVPFRRHDSPAPGIRAILPGSLAGAPVVESAIAEAWFHPHMASIAIHFTVTGAMSPDDMVSACLALRRDRVLALPGTATAHKLDEIATRCLDTVYLEAVGERNAEGLAPANPFSVVTVLQGDSAADPNIAPGGPVHRALEAVTQWDAGKHDGLEAGRTSSRPATDDGPLLLSRARSRAVWDSRRFALAGSVSLSCYHRNLLLSALQTEALLAFAQVAEDEAAAGRRPKSIRDCEDAVLKRIVALHAGEDTTYRSISLKRFIDEHPLRPSVDELSKRIWSSSRLPSLPAPVPP